ncbi:hypothetical protein Ae201684P_006210 [Aphanomyces euteiches]|uniref:Uncharacterized protein n=1 Tax=Aphanomyces euteiches TaxID=100861 RepID=A0A6G0XBY1_9STRA|nr:hypothetical protein Ae201684_006323 [Aphanomyces euteiches]KAH9090805.1 hypothetical protein Ae201684P_006210 [Aphanomyces euteiches]
MERSILQLSVHAKDKPPVIFVWKNVEGFVEAIQEARAKASAPEGMPLPPNPLALSGSVTIQKFKEAVLEYARVSCAAPRLGTSCLPCSLAQFGQVMCMLRTLDLNPWSQRVIAVGVPNSLPIACVYIPRPRSNTLRRATPHFVASLWG